MTRRIILCLIACAAGSIAQTPKAFETVSVKYSGTSTDHMTRTPNGDYTMHVVRPEYKGTKFLGDAALREYVQFACSGLLTPYRDEYPSSLMERSQGYYQISAVAPEGTTLDEARVMLRQVLVERLGFAYRLIDKDVPTFNLMRGSGELKLTPSTEAPGPEFHGSPWEWKVNSSVTNFANFLSVITARPVIDKTGIEGRYKFDLDWKDQVQEAMAAHAFPDPSIAVREIKPMGLKLEPSTESRTFLVIDKVNKEPTPN